MSIFSLPQPRIAEPFPTTVSSPRLDLISLAWDHISNRYLKRLEPDRVIAGRVRSIRLLAAHDAIHSVIDPGNGYVFKEVSPGSSTTAAAAAAIQASHDILASIFDDPADQDDLRDHLEESLALLGGEAEKSAGISSGTRSAAAYLQAFSTLLLTARRPQARGPVPYAAHDRGSLLLHDRRRSA